MRFAAPSFGLLLILLPSCAAEEVDEMPLYSLEVDTGRHDRIDVPIQADLPVPLPAEVRLIEVTSGLAIPVPCQLDPVLPSRLHFVLDSDTPLQSVRQYEVFAGRQESRRQVEVTEDSDGNLEVSWNGQTVLRYNTGLVRPPDPDVDPLFWRSAYLHPILTPAGSVVTDDFPPDHPHQRGVWFAWAKTRFQERSPDFWNLGEGTGSVRFKKLEATFQGPVMGGFRVQHEHIDLSAPESPSPVLEEVWDVRVHGLGGARRGYFLFDLQSLLRCASPEPLTLPEYHYGGLGFRGPREWNPGVAEVVADQGQTRIELDGTRQDWVALQGPIGRRFGGLGVFGHPENFRSPQAVRVHPTNPYFAFSPVRSGSMNIEPGQEYRSSYRMLVFDGPLDAPVARPFWWDFSDPPEVRVRPGR